MSLSDEQRQLIESKRLNAQALRQQRLKKQPVQTNTAHARLVSTDIYQNSTSSKCVNSSRSDLPFSAPANERGERIVDVSHKPKTIQEKIEENRLKALALRANKNAKSESMITSPTPHPAALSTKETDKQIAPNFDAPNPKTTQPYTGPVHLATCCLLSSTRFSVVSKFHKQLIEVIRSVPSRQYHDVSSRWSLSLEDHENFVNKCTATLSPQIKVERLPKFVIQSLKRSYNQSIEICDSNPLKSKLLPFQKTGVEFVLSLNGRALIADDMGLGKTIQALCVMREYLSEWPLLIICPSSLRLTWSEAVTTWIPEIQQDDIFVMLSGGVARSFGKVNIVSYDLLHKYIGEFKGRFQCAIADESHFIKNGKTARCKAAAQILQETKRCVLLSGTPALSRPIELYTQLQCVNRRKMPGMIEYGKRYCAGKQTAWGWDYTGNSNLEELNLFIYSCFMIRRLKKDVLNELPSKRRKKIIIETKMSKGLSCAASSTSRASKADYQACLFDYYSATAAAKLAGVIQYMRELLEGGCKFILFAHHKVMLSGVREFLQKDSIPHILIDGNTAAEKRHEHCSRFQTDPHCVVALLSLTAANTGFTLTAAHTVVFAELNYNPGVLQQAEDRVHRIGQKNSVVIHYLVAPKTSDDIMWPMIESKLSVLGNMGVGGGNFRDAEASSFAIPEQGGKQTDIGSFFTGKQEGPSCKKQKFG